jgi:hypothetical protein
MKKVIRLTESDLARIVKRIIKENSNMETINVPRKYKYVIMEVGNNPTIKQIKDLYRKYTEGGDLWEPAPLKTYNREEDRFYDEVGDSFSSDKVLNFINYSIQSEKYYDDEDEDF